MIEAVELNELMDLLQQQHAEMLPQWYCDLNCYRKPDGFPIDLGEVDRAHHENPAFRMAYNAVSLALGEAGTSLAWWQIELGKTEAEWKEWWVGRGLPLPSNTR